MVTAAESPAGVAASGAVVAGAGECAAPSLDAVVEALPAGVVVLDGSGQVRLANRAARALLGGVTVGSDWRSVVERCFTPATDDSFDVRLRDGRRVQVATDALPDRAGQVVLLSDVSDLRALQDELRRLTVLVAKGQVSAALAHQVRTPLASAILYLSLVDADSVPDRRQREALLAAGERLRHLERLVGDMLNLARDRDLAREPVRAASLLAALRRSLHAQLDDGRFRLMVADRSGGATVMASRDALVSALGNLAINAWQACDGAGRLSVIAQRRDGRLVISVRDHGPGLPPAVAARVFEPFVTTRRDGTGLGLAIVRAIVQAHGGSIHHEAPRDGGARFVIALPLAGGGRER